MENFCNQSTFELLPDEILLEVCKYLLCSDILHSFVGLNTRITQMIAQYRHHVSLHKTSISIFDNLCVNILPHIGSQIRTLLIDCCYSVLQDELFIQYFGKKMSIMFPQLERISLVSYENDQLVAFLSTLRDLDHLVEIRLYKLLSIERLYQPTLVRSLLQANNHRVRTIFIDDQSSSLSFSDTDCYLNILQLRINLDKKIDLFSLFTVVPNVQHLDVMLRGTIISSLFENFDKIELSPLLHLTNFQLNSTKYKWKLEDLSILLVQLPIIRHLSLFFYTYDRRLVKGDIILSLLPSTIQQFNYAVYYFSDTIFDEDDSIAASWPPSHPVGCFFNDRFLFMHTLPWHFTRIEISSLVGRVKSSGADRGIGYDRKVEQLDLHIGKIFTLGKSLSVISQCRRVREININLKNDDDGTKEEQLPLGCVSKLSRLIQICFYGSKSSDLNSFSSIINAAPNLYRLDLPCDYLLRLIKDQQICHLLSQCITSLSIHENGSGSSLSTLNEEHIPIIASIFSRVRDLYVNLAHLPSSTTIVSKENNLEDSTVQNLSVEPCEQKSKIISPFSSESMLLCLLKEFKEHRLIGLCIIGKFLEMIKIDTEEWLQQNTILCKQKFKANFNNEFDRLLIWL